MAGLHVNLGGGATVSSVVPSYTSGAVTNPAGVASPAIMAYGPSTTNVSASTATAPGNVAVYAGVAALIGLLLIRKSLPS